MNVKAAAVPMAIAYVCNDQAETSVLFELISARYERRSLLITANQPFGEWGRILESAELAGAKRGTLLVQASQTIASFWLLRYLVEFRRAYPGIDVRLGIGNTAQVASAVRVGVAELGFVDGVVTNPALVIHEVARDQLRSEMAARGQQAHRNTHQKLASGD